jgi:hypothetical protein
VHRRPLIDRHLGLCDGAIAGDITGKAAVRNAKC